MKINKKIILMVVLVVSLCFVLVACNNAKSFEEYSKFNAEEITKVVVTDEFGVTKTLNDKDNIDALVNGIKDEKVKKYDKKTNVKAGAYVFSFYFKDQEGYLKYTFNKGYEAIDKCKVKFNKDNYYFENYESALEKINSVFYGEIN